MDTNVIKVLDVDGREIEYRVLLTYDSKKYNKKYIIYTDEKELMASILKNNDNNTYDIFPIEDDNEWNEIEKVLKKHNLIQ